MGDSLEKKDRRTPEMIILGAIKQKCRNENSQDYQWYGGKGIKVTSEWDSIGGFMRQMGARPSKGYCLSRIDKAKDFNKENCYWAKDIRQTRSTSERPYCEIMHGGESTIDASLRLGGHRTMVYKRIVVYGWSVTRAFTSPVHVKKAVTSS